MRTVALILMLSFSGCAVLSTAIRDCASLCKDGRVQKYQDEEKTCSCRGDE